MTLFALACTSFLPIFLACDLARCTGWALTAIGELVGDGLWSVIEDLQ